MAGQPHTLCVCVHACMCACLPVYQLASLSYGHGHQDQLGSLRQASYCHTGESKPCPYFMWSDLSPGSLPQHCPTPESRVWMLQSGQGFPIPCLRQEGPLWPLRSEVQVYTSLWTDTETEPRILVPPCRALPCEVKQPALEPQGLRYLPISRSHPSSRERHRLYGAQIAPSVSSRHNPTAHSSSLIPFPAKPLCSRLLQLFSS